MKAHVRMLVALVVLLAAVVTLAGCSSGGGGTVFLNLYQRSSWAQITNGRIALSSYGGNGLRYVYDIDQSGGGLSLLTPSFNQSPPVNVLEGGWQPSFSPNGATVAFVSRRGTNPSDTLYSFPTATGDRSTLNTPLAPLPSDATGAQGSDSEPNWSPDGTTIIYSSTRVNGAGSLRTIPAAGGTPTNVLADGNENQWPCYNPVNPNQIVYQSNNGLTGQTDPYNNQTPTGIFILDTSQPLVAGTNPHQIGPGSPDHFTDGAPSWSPDGTQIAFHSDRSGDYDIWIFVVADSSLIHLTSDARSDGFPVWNQTGTAVAFTRDRELWTINADGTNAKQLTRRFQ